MPAIIKITFTDTDTEMLRTVYTVYIRNIPEYIAPIWSLNLGDT